MTPGEKIKALRTELDMTLEEVGRKVGVGKSTVRKWESGEIANMRRDKIAKLAEALGTTPGYLFDWDEDEVESSSHPTEEDIRFALFDGDCTDAQFEEVKRFAAFIKERDGHADG